MTVWKDLSEQEYRALKALLAELDRTEAKLSTRFRDSDVEQIRGLDDMRLKMRSAVEGYEAIHGREDE